MSDFDSALAVRSAVGRLFVKVTDTTNNPINPAREDGNLADVKTNTDKLDVLLSTRASEATLSTMSGKLPATLGQANMAGSFSVVIASNQTAIPVTISGNGADKVNILDQNTGSSVATNGNSVHTYTGISSGSVIQRVIASASGRCKVEVWFGATGSETLKAVKFVSPANPNADVVFDDGLRFDNTKSLLVKRYNLDNQAQDVYSTVMGYEA